MEFCILVQMECVNCSIRAYIPFFSEIWREIQFWVEGDQSAEDQFVSRAIGGGGIIIAWIRGLAACYDQSLVQRHICLQRRGGIRYSNSETKCKDQHQEDYF